MVDQFFAYFQGCDVRTRLICERKFRRMNFISFDVKFTMKVIYGSVEIVLGDDDDGDSFDCVLTQ